MKHTAPLAFLAFSLIGLFGAAAQAETAAPEACAAVKSRDLSIVVPVKAGGGYDTYARALASTIEASAGLSARVVNMPGASGRVAVESLLRTKARDLAVLVQDANAIAFADGGDFTTLNRFLVLGSIHAEPFAWMGRDDLELTKGAEPLVGGVATAGADFFSIELPGFALGHRINLISGIGGSGELIASAVRREVDFVRLSLATALRGAQTEGLAVALTLSEGEAAPGVPYLAGEGSLVWESTEGLPEAERNERRSAAVVAARASIINRSLLAPAQLLPENLACLEALFDAALFDPGFLDAVAAQGRPAAPKTAADNRAGVAAALTVYDENLALIERVGGE